MMVRDDQDRGGPAAAGRTPAAARGVGVRTAVAALVGVAVLAAGAAVAARLWLLPGDPPLSAKEPAGPGLAPAGSPAAAAPPLVKDWPAPDLVLLLSGQQHGYLLPCGCSRPQYGGLERRYNLLQELKARRWPVVALDLGDVAQVHGPQMLPNVQGPIKYQYSMKALKAMDYAAAGIGEYEMALPLREALDGWALNEPKPRILCANLKDKETNFAEEVYSAHLADKVPGTALKVGVIGVVGPSVVNRFGSKDRLVNFDPVPSVLPGLVKQLEAQKADVKVLLYQGSLDEAKRCAAKVPGFQVMLCLSESDNAPARAEKVGNTLIVGVGHKGKSVGVVGLSRTNNAGKPFDLRYQMVTLGPEFETPKGKEDGHPVVALMEEYTRELKDRNYLAKYVQGNHPHQGAVPGASPTYVGSEACKDCHKHAYKVWKDSGHAHAYQTLVDAKRPSLRQYDGECIVCHVTGFTYKGGFTDEQKTPHLKDVGCESCHGPGSEH